MSDIPTVQVKQVPGQTWAVVVAVFGQAVDARGVEIALGDSVLAELEHKHSTGKLPASAFTIMHRPNRVPGGPLIEVAMCPEVPGAAHRTGTVTSVPAIESVPDRAGQQIHLGGVVALDLRDNRYWLANPSNDKNILIYSSAVVVYTPRQVKTVRVCLASTTIPMTGPVRGTVLSVLSGSHDVNGNAIADGDVVIIKDVVGILFENVGGTVEASVESNKVTVVRNPYVTVRNTEVDCGMCTGKVRTLPTIPGVPPLDADGVELKVGDNVIYERCKVVGSYTLTMDPPITEHLLLPADLDASTTSLVALRPVRTDDRASTAILTNLVPWDNAYESGVEGELVAWMDNTAPRDFPVFPGVDHVVHVLSKADAETTEVSDSRGGISYHMKSTDIGTIYVNRA